MEETKKTTEEKVEKVEGEVVDKDGKPVEPEETKEPKAKWTTKLYDGCKKHKKKILGVLVTVGAAAVGYVVGSKRSDGGDDTDYYTDPEPTAYLEDVSETSDGTEEA